MKRIFHCIIFFAALVFWIGFVLTWKLGNDLIDEPRYRKWRWLKVKAVYRKNITGSCENCGNYNNSDWNCHCE